MGIALPMLGNATGVGEGGVVEASVVVGVSAAFSFSSTPWPLQSGQELRPVVSHWLYIRSPSKALRMRRGTYLVDALPMKHMPTFDKPSSLFLQLELTQADQAALFRH